jgi:DNA-binding response OmpR family regulator
MPDRPLILMLDRNRANLDVLAQVLAQAGCRARGAASLEEFDRALAGEDGVALALLDLAGLDQGVWDRCERLRAMDVPFLILSGRQSAALQQAGLSHGARGVLAKPLALREFIDILRTLLAEGQHEPHPAADGSEAEPPPAG